MNQDSWPPIADIIPHKGDMLLLDRIVGEEGKVLKIAAGIGESHIFSVPGFGVPGWLCFELMAQGVAAHDGLSNWRQGEGPKLGFLVACRSCTCAVEWFEIGDRFEISIWPVTEPNDIMVWGATLHRGGAEIASADIIVHQPKDVEAFIAKARAS